MRSKTAGPVGEKLNLDSIPVVPMIRISVDESGKFAEVSGVRVTPSGDQTIFDAVVDHVHAQHVVAESRPGIRCSARMNGTLHRFIVDEHGNSYNVTRAKTKKRVRASKGTAIGLVIGSVLVLSGTGLIVSHQMTSSSADPTHVAHVAENVWQDQGEIPKVPIANFARRSVWISSPVASKKDVLQIDPSRLAVLAKTESGGQAIHFVDIDTGAILHSVAAPERVLGGLHLRRVHGSPAVLWKTKSGINSVSLSSPHHVAVAKLGAQAKISPSFDFLIHTPTQVGILDESRTGWKVRVLPAGAKPVAVDGDAVIAVNKTGESWRLTDPKVAPAPTKIPVVSGKITGIVTVSPSHLVVGVKDDKHKLSLASFHLPGLERDWTVESENVLSDRPKVSPLRTWMISGKTAVDLKTGSKTELGRSWHTKGITEHEAWTSGFTREHATKMSSPTKMSGDTPSGAVLPQWSTENTGIMLISGRNGIRLHAQPRSNP